MAAWQRLAPYSGMLSRLLGTDQLVGSLADVGKKEIEGLAGAHEKLAHSFLSEHPARSRLHKKDIRAMQSLNCHYTLDLALTLSTLVRHWNDTCIVCPISLNANLKVGISAERAPDTGRPVHLSPGLWRVAGLTTLQSAGHLRFGFWLLLPQRTPPTIITNGVQLDLQVNPSTSIFVCR
jgi:hypothetical protein